MSAYVHQPPRGEAGQLRRDVKSRGMRATERIDLSAELRHGTTTRIISPRERVVVFVAAATATAACAIGIRAASAVVPAGRLVCLRNVRYY